MSPLDKSHITDLLRREWQALAELCAPLTEDQWHAMTQCTGWTVKDNISHIIGTERMLAGDPPPDVDIGKPDYVKNEIGATNEKWVAQRRGREPEEVLAEFGEVCDRRLAMLEAKTQEEFEAPSWTPAGEDTYARFMQIRLFDCWTHEQDIRQAIDLPGHSSGDIVDEVYGEVCRSMGYVVGKLGGAPAGSNVEFRLAHESAPESAPEPRVLRVECPSDGGRASVVSEFSAAGGATETIAMDLMLFFRLTAGRESCEQALADGRVKLDGNLENAEQITKNLAYVF